MKELDSWYCVEIAFALNMYARDRERKGMKREAELLFKLRGEILKSYVYVKRIKG